MTDVDILIKFPSRSRPDKMLRHLWNISTTIGIKKFAVVLVLDEDDETITDEVIGRIVATGARMDVRVLLGKSKSKVHAINRMIPEGVIDWKYMIVTSDDMEFTRDHWGEIVVAAFKHTNKGCLHFPDGHNNSLITLPVMSKPYFNRFGYVYHPDYENVFPDNEMTEVAKILNEYYFVPIDIVEHKHYRWGYGEPDEQNKIQDGNVAYAKDVVTFNNRKKMNFGL